jgi:serine phosphatase RsbU (regulator of sigma subunit)
MIAASARPGRGSPRDGVSRRPTEAAFDARATGFDARVTVWNSPSGAARAGGDWCDAVALSDSALALTIGDVSGHGEGVAQTMAVVRTAVLGAIREIRTPSDVLAAANDVAFRERDGIVVTAIVAVLDTSLRTLTFANAGHPPPLMLTATDHAFLAPSPADLPLGIFAHHRAADHVVAVVSDALVVLYTDGVTEHDRDPIGGERELVSAARAVYERPAFNAARAIARQVFRAGRGTDDAAAIGLRTLALPPLPRRNGRRP